MKQSRTPQLNRRYALAGAGTAGALAAAAVALPIRPGAPAPTAAAGGTASDDHGRYQETQHVLRYYQTTRV